MSAYWSVPVLLPVPRFSLHADADVTPGYDEAKMQAEPVIGWACVVTDSGNLQLESTPKRENVTHCKALITH